MQIFTRYPRKEYSWHDLKQLKGRYTKTQLVAYLTEFAEAQGHEGITKKAVGEIVDEMCATLIRCSKEGANLPGVGKLVLKKTPARPARKGRNPATGEEIMIPRKPAGKKLARISKAAKVAGIIKE